MAVKCERAWISGRRTLLACASSTTGGAARHATTRLPTGAPMTLPTTLSQFLTVNRDELIKRTRAKVAGRSSPTVNAEELEHGVPLFLSQLSETLEIEGLGGTAPSAGAGPTAHPNI